MKKIFMLFAIMFGLSMVSCGGQKTTEATEVVEETVTEVVEENGVQVSDSTVVTPTDTVKAE